MSDDLLAPCLTGKYENKIKSHSWAGSINHTARDKYAKGSYSSPPLPHNLRAERTLRRSYFEAEVVGWYLVISPHVAAEVRCKKNDFGRRILTADGAPSRGVLNAPYPSPPSPFGYVYCRQTLGGQCRCRSIGRPLLSLPSSRPSKRHCPSIRPIC